MRAFDLPEIWNKMVEKLSNSTSEINMNMYIRQITPVKMENDVIYATVHSTSLRSSIQQNFYDLITAILSEITDNENIQLKIDVENQGNLEIPKPDYSVVPLFPEDEKIKEEPYESNLNEKQRFDTFVVGNSNRFAAAAAQAVAVNPGNTYNPLFIYGNSGLGKTHLMHAIGNAVLSANPSVMLFYLPTPLQKSNILQARLLQMK